jgi:cytochrome c
MVNALLISTVIFIAWVNAVLAQDVTAGEAAFRKCQVCHDVGENARSKLGPPLNGLDGRKAASVEGYAYSEANKNSGITWDEAAFKEYIKDPAAKIPGTKMIFSDKDEKEIDDLWAYLKQFGADGTKK